MASRVMRLTRRQALMAGAGLAGTLAMIGPGRQARAATSQLRAQTAQGPSTADWQQVAAVFGVPGKMQPGGVLMIALPRSDIQATVYGMPIHSGLALNVMITFLPTTSGALAKYEMCLLDSEVDPVLDALFAQGAFQQIETFAALHSHLLETDPKIKFVHGTVEGDAMTLAQGIRAALGQTSTPFGAKSQMNGTGLDDQGIAQMIGGMASVDGSVLTVSVPRNETILQLGAVLPPAMQVQSAFNFQSMGSGQAAAFAEFVVLPEEVDAVSRVLRSSHVAVTALHNHELTVRPKLYYVHGFGTGDPSQIAQALHAALLSTNSMMS